MKLRTMESERRDDVLWIWFDRPEVRNCINLDVVGDLGAIADAVLADEGLRCLVIGGRGGVFCAGGDIGGAGADPQAAVALAAEISGAFARIETLPLPVIAMVEGVALAGGLELMLCCDIVFASETARFGDGHARVGLVPGGGGSVRLPRRIGAGRAKQMMFTGTLFGASQMLNWGLVDTLVPDTRLEAAVAELAASIAEGSPLALRRMKRLVAETAAMDIDMALAHEQRALGEQAGSHDMAEGLVAFAERRKPRFTGQ
jgi:enoyl-CoA hydratase/carnithine racemase